MKNLDKNWLKFLEVFVDVLHMQVTQRLVAAVSTGNPAEGPTLKNLASDLKNHPMLRKFLEPWTVFRVQMFVSTLVRSGAVKNKVMTNRGMFEKRYAGSYYACPDFKAPSAKEMEMIYRISAKDEARLQKLFEEVSKKAA